MKTCVSAVAIGASVLSSLHYSSVMALQELWRNMHLHALIQLHQENNILKALVASNSGVNEREMVDLLVNRLIEVCPGTVTVDSSEQGAAVKEQ